jgi:microcystin-dependent protein
MALTDANTYVLPSQGASIAVSRSQFNNSLRALLQNFYSGATPDTDNLVAEGSAMGATAYDGMWYRDSDTGMFYVSDSAITVASGRTNRPVGGNFTRYGVAWRQQGSLAAAAANIATFDVGEAFVVVKDSGGSSNNRMYLRVATTGTFNSDFVDVGLPFPGSVGTTDLTDGAVTGPKLNATMSAPSTRTLTPRLLINTLANNQTAYNSAAIELKTNTVTNDVALGFNNSTKQATIKMIPGNTGDTDRGLGVYTTAAALAPIRANLVVQSTIFGSTSETAAPLIPAGVVVAWAGSSAPSGWLECSGAAISRTTYSALFAICSTNYGLGNGSSTFNLPDARGRAIYGTSTSVSLGATSTAIGSSFQNSTASGGPTSHTVGTTTVSASTNKDVSTTTTVVTSVADHAAHTHTVTHPGISMKYIIKT